MTAAWRFWVPAIIVGALACEGPTGPRGGAGEGGPSGPQGEPGPAGAPGSVGVQGSRGADGQVGAAGADGADGVDGRDAVTVGTLEGVVRAGGAPVADATVVLLDIDAVARTGEDGTFAFAELPAGVYDLSVRAEDLAPWRDETVPVFAGQTTTLDVTLQTPGEAGDSATLAGEVRTPAGAALVGAEVFTDFGGHRTVTDAEGAFTLRVAPGTYAVSASVPGLAFRAASAVDLDLVAGALVEVELVLAAGDLEGATYVGSSACAPCHAGVYAQWADSLHANAVRPLDAVGTGAGPVVAAPWEGEVALEDAAQGLPATTVRLVRDDDGRPAFELTDAVSGAVRRYTVWRSQGAGRWTQRYQVRLAGAHHLAPMQWNAARGRWAPYELEQWVDAQGRLREPDADRSFEVACQGCHSTGLRLDVGPDEGVTARYTELNIGCERCHGPGSRHVQAPRADAIDNPRRLLPLSTAGIVDADGQVVDAEGYAAVTRAQEACGQCHARGRSNAAAPGQPAVTGRFGFPWVEARGAEGQLGFGEPLDAALVPADAVFSLRYDGSTPARASEQQYTEQASAAAAGGGHGHNPFHLVTCFDCHSPHGGGLKAQLRLPADDNSLCLSCHAPHGFSTQDEIRAHTQHRTYAPSTTGASRCTGCHMPATARSAEPNDIHAHTFRIIAPHETRDAVVAGEPAIRNACNACHAMDADFGVLRFEALFGQPVPLEGR